MAEGEETETGRGGNEQKNMKPEAQRIAIAESCGWTPSKVDHCWNNPSRMETRDELPDYMNDLNAMHEAEKHFDGKPVDLRSLWVDNLAVCGDWPKTKNAMELKFEVSYAMQRLTAAQRAEAFLRTMGRWEDHP